MNGISYFAMNQWSVAQHQPPHLAAICVWEGAADYYREAARHGGIYCSFLDNLYPRAVHRVQHGLGERGLRSRVTGELVCGPPDACATRSSSATGATSSSSCSSIGSTTRRTRERTPDFGEDHVAAVERRQLGRAGAAPARQFRRLPGAASTQKWLEVHGDAHWAHFYTDYGVRLQKRFFGHFLKGEDTGWDAQPRVQLQVRHPGENFVERHENEWPLARTQWTKFYLDPASMSLAREGAEARNAAAPTTRLATGSLL